MVDRVQSHWRALAAAASAAVEDLGAAVALVAALDNASILFFPMVPKVILLTALGAPVWWQW
jgi:hypothetical protein